MNGKRAKKIRRMVYGDFTSNAEGRKYQVKKTKNNITGITTGQIIADHRRQAYQKAKKDIFKTNTNRR